MKLEKWEIDATLTRDLFCSLIFSICVSCIPFFHFGINAWTVATFIISFGGAYLFLNWARRPYLRWAGIIILYLIDSNSQLRIIDSLYLTCRALFEKYFKISIVDPSTLKSPNIDFYLSILAGFLILAELIRETFTLRFQKHPLRISTEKKYALDKDDLTSRDFQLQSATHLENRTSNILNKIQDLLDELEYDEAFQLFDNALPWIEQHSGSFSKEKREECIVRIAEIGASKEHFLQETEGHSDYKFSSDLLDKIKENSNE